MTKQLQLISEPQYSIRRKAKKCVVCFCQNSAGNKGKFRFCYKHHRQHQKINNPLRYWFDVLRQNARRRNIFFGLVIGEFKEFCEETHYLELKGKSAGDCTIDRIRNELGYVKGNLQILTLSQNSRKYWIDLKLRFGYYPTDEELKEFYGGKLPEINADGVNESTLKLNTNNTDGGVEDCPF